MKTRTLKTVCGGVAGVACIALIAFAAKPPPPPSSGGLPTGWHWTGEGAVCMVAPISTCDGAWNDRHNWMWHAGDPAPPPPSGDYPQERGDDVYLAWSDDTYTLFVSLTTERIDSLEVKGYANGSTQSVTFESVSQADNTLECNHATFKAIDGTLFVTVKDDATVQTVY